MVVDSKRKGSNFEREIVKRFNMKVRQGEFKRIPGSGALGTNLGMPSLTGDIDGCVAGLPKKLKGESKIGYGGAKSMTLKKEWLDKIKLEAEASYALPFLVGRFSGARSGVEEFIVLDLDTFTDLLNLISEMGNELDKRADGLLG